MQYYNRYRKFTFNGEVIPILPFIVLPIKTSDKSKIWNINDRLDKISYEYYGHPYGGWLIMLVNSEYGSDEFDIPENSLIRIPFPYRESLQQYIEQIDFYNNKYGL